MQRFAFATYLTDLPLLGRTFDFSSSSDPPIYRPLQSQRGPQRPPRKDVSFPLGSRIIRVGAALPESLKAAPSNTDVYF
jgi:hypothetical protein